MKICWFLQGGGAIISNIRLGEKRQFFNYKKKKSQEKNCFFPKNVSKSLKNLYTKKWPKFIYNESDSKMVKNLYTKYPNLRNNCPPPPPNNCPPLQKSTIFFFKIFIFGLKSLIPNLRNNCPPPSYENQWNFKGRGGQLFRKFG